MSALDIVRPTVRGGDGAALTTAVGPTTVTVFIVADDERVYTLPPDTVKLYVCIAELPLHSCVFSAYCAVPAYTYKAMSALEFGEGLRVAVRV
jgi:hypothetical protein